MQLPHVQCLEDFVSILITCEVWYAGIIFTGASVLGPLAAPTDPVCKVACEVWYAGIIFTTSVLGPLAAPITDPACKATALEIEELEVLELELKGLASPPVYELWPGPSGYGKIDAICGAGARCSINDADVTVC